jgi:two-component system chemotaxis response regulator CheB
MIAPHGAFEVAGSAGGGDEALAVLAHQPADIVLLDLDMPGTSGLQALAPILATGARVLIVSSSCEEGAEASVAALALGAADTLAKPGAGVAAASFSAALVERLKRIGGIEEPRGPAAEAPIFTLRDASVGPLDCLVLGGSTGGLHAVTAFLRALPPSFDAPILITQHLPAAFMPFFARQIEAAAGRRAEIAGDGHCVGPGSILIAPGDSHLLVERQGNNVLARLAPQAARGGYCPSVDRMIEAAADAYGEGTMAVLFSGMGRDGLAGARKLAERGGTVVAQDRESSAVWGMPRAVAEAGLASAVLPPAELAQLAAARLRSA